MADLPADPKADEGFPGRVLATSAVVGGVFLTFSLRSLPLEVSLGFLVGTAASMLGFYSWKLLVDRAIQAGPEVARKKARSWVFLLTLIKLPALGLLLATGLFYLQADVMAMAAGIALVPGIVVLKVLGRTWFGAGRRPIGAQLR